MPYPCTDTGCPVGPGEHGHLDPLPPIPGNHPGARSFAADVIRRQTNALADCRDALRASRAEVAALRRALEDIRLVVDEALHRMSFDSDRLNRTGPTYAECEARRVIGVVDAALARGEPSP